MVDIPQELKDKLKQQRLDQYRVQIYNLKMDLSAYEAIGDQEMIEHTKRGIESGEKAYKAVEEMV